MEQLADKVYVETEYAGINVGALITKKGIVCIDIPSYPRDARHWVDQLHMLDPRPIRYIIITNCHGDRLLNARWLNAPLITHQTTADRLIGYDKRYPQPLLDSLIARNPDAGRDLSNSPVERASLSFTEDMSLFYHDHEVKLRYLPGPECGSVCVHLVDAGILFTGDLLTVDTCPMLAQSDIDAWLQSLEFLRQPEYNASVIVPGRGPITEASSLTVLAEFIHDVRAYVRQFQQQNRPRSELNAYVGEIMYDLPAGYLPREWIQAQLRAGLEYIYDQMKTKARPEQPG